MFRMKVEPTDHCPLVLGLRSQYQHSLPSKGAPQDGEVRARHARPSECHATQIFDYLIIILL